MRRAAAIALGIVAILASSCGEGSMPPRLATALENRVATIRELAEGGRPGPAIAATRDLMTFVTGRLEAGVIDDSKAVEILDAAQLVVQRLQLLPRPTAETSPSPSPSPTEEEGHEPGEKKGKDKGKGHGEDGNSGGHKDED